MLNYPESAGWKSDSTSRDAATAIESSGRATHMRAQVMRTFSIFTKGMTADEVANYLNESILSIRPRCAELHKQGLIEKTGLRRRSNGGRPSHVWKLTPPPATTGNTAEQDG